MTTCQFHFALSDAARVSELVRLFASLVPVVITSSDHIHKPATLTAICENTGQERLKVGNVVNAMM
jgi:hypothetical protein